MINIKGCSYGLPYERQLYRSYYVPSSTRCSAALTGKFDEKIIEFILGTHQAAALLLFNASKKLSYCEIKAHLKLTYAGVVRLLQSLSFAEYMIVTKVRRSKIVSEIDVSQFSLTFVDMMRSIRYVVVVIDDRLYIEGERHM
ncbi:Cullin [Artemisia annua]|uniref:Cullin n=1 Tax=Artemisia annua TaxID=35608 RepID=A0A2U1MPH8_ARTAN|nr:Cullin [Artemisia annua]